MEALDPAKREELSSGGESWINRDLWHAFVERAWLIVCILVAAVGVGIWTGSRAQVVYQSRAVVSIESGEQVVMKIDEVQKQDPRGSVDVLTTIANNMHSSGVLRRVVGIKELVKHPYFNRGSNAPTEERIVVELANAVDARLRRMTRLIDVTAELGDPVLAQIIAQSVVEEFIKQTGEDRVGSSTNAGQFLISEQGRIKERLLVAEQAVQQYLKTNSVSPLQQGQDLILEELKTRNERLSEAKAARRLSETDFDMARQFGNKVTDLLSLTSIARSPDVIALREKMQKQEAEVASLQLRFKDKHPDMIEARLQLDNDRRLFEAEVLRAPVRLQQQLKVAADKERDLEKAVKDHEAKLSQLGSQRYEFERLQSAVALERALYDAIIKRVGEIEITGGIKKNDMKIIEPASRPIVPIRPNKRLIMVYSIVLGLGFSVGLVWLLVQLDHSIKSVDHAERTLGLPVLGAVPRNKLVRDGKSRLFISDDPQSLCAEAFRSMRASLGLLGREEERKVVFFTSALPSEGKSFCCVNYAVAFSQQGRRTLIIDFDLRKPTLHESFGLPSENAGVAEVLLGKAPLDQCVQKTQFEHLFVLTAGGTVPNPAELLSGPWAKEMIREAVTKFDKVVLDNAPINAVSDALLVVSEAQTICLVANARKTSLRVVQRALEMLRRAGVKPSGVVLNFLPQGAGSGYYYYYSGNKYYGKDGVYGHKGVYGRQATYGRKGVYDPASSDR